MRMTSIFVHCDCQSAKGTTILPECEACKNKIIGKFKDWTNKVRTM